MFLFSLHTIYIYIIYIYDIYDINQHASGNRYLPTVSQSRQIYNQILSRGSPSHIACQACTTPDWFLVVLYAERTRFWTAPREQKWC